MEDEVKYLSSEDMNKLVLMQERLVNEKLRIDMMKLQADKIKLSKRIQELELEKLGWTEYKHIEAIRDAKDKFRQSREGYQGFIQTLTKKYKTDLSHGFDDSTGEILTSES